MYTIAEDLGTDRQMGQRMVFFNDDAGCTPRQGVMCTIQSTSITSLSTEQCTEPVIAQSLSQSPRCTEHGTESVFPPWIEECVH